MTLDTMKHWFSSSNLGVDLYISDNGTIHDSNDPDLEALDIDDLEASIIHWLNDGTESLTDQSADGDWGWIRRNWPAVITIRNTNELFGEDILFTGITESDAVAKMQAAISELGYDDIVSEDDYEHMRNKK